MINFSAHKKDFVFLPLGGCNEIGINVNLYHFNGKWIMVDLGSGFADDSTPGVDMIVADLDFVRRNQKNILGLILTHAHEDHLGGISYLFDDISFPVYATNFTANFLKSKLNEYSFASNLDIRVVEPGSSLELGPFQIEMLGLAHSTAEMQALMIRTEACNIFHTGDWKFDENPIIGKNLDQNKLIEFGKEGVKAIICDSTNIFNSGSSGSEGEVRTNLIELVKKCKEMVVITTFASNLARLDSIIQAASLSNRKLVLSGRSLHRMLESAKASGYLKNTENVIIDESIAFKYKRSELLVAATGCQGEHLAATNKLVQNTHKYIKLLKNDTVIFSSKIIPGNEKKIFKMVNELVKKNVEVITERDHLVHVSGHPAKDELAKMYELIKPEISVPVHGEAMHIHAHSNFARKLGVKDAIELTNGDVLKLSGDKAEIIGRVHSGYLAVDGNYLIDINSSIFKFRKRLKEAGAIFVSLVLNKKHKLLAPVTVYAPGSIDESLDLELIDMIKYKIEISLEDYASKFRISNDIIKKDISSLVKKTVKKELGKTPQICVSISII